MAPKIKTPSEVTVKLDTLEEYPGNPRRHNEAQLEELRRSLNLFGQYRPLVLNSKSEILAGNGMYQAMRSLGWEEGRAIVMADLSEDDQKKLVLADNQIARMGFTDYDAVDNLLKSIGDFEVPGYDPQVISQLLSSTDEALEEAMEYGVIDVGDIARIEERGETYDVDEINAQDDEHGAPRSGPVEVTKHFTAPEETLAEASEGSACVTCGRPW